MVKKEISKQSFSALFWKSVDKEIVRQKRSYSWLCRATGIKRTTLLTARAEKRELLFSTAVLVLKALDIPTWWFTVRLYRELKEAQKSENISD